MFIGIKFYTEVGNLMVGNADEGTIRKVQHNAEAQTVSCKMLSPKELAKQFPYLDFPSGEFGVLEDRNAGHINPRKLIEAQKRIASNHGCKYFDDVVQSVTRVAKPNGAYVMEVKAANGEVIICEKVLVATGSFTTFRHLLPNLEPEQGLCPLTVALVEISDGDAEKMK